MAVVTLKMAVARLDEVLEQFDQIKVYRSTTGTTGTYLEITGPGSRIALVEGTLVYEYTDVSGDTGYFYKSSYYNSVSTLESSLSDAQQGESDTALQVLSVSELQTYYLFGLDMTNDEGEPFPDSLYEFYIKAAVSWFEQKVNIPVRPTYVEAEKHDYYPGDIDQYFFMQLEQYPIISVEKVDIVIPGTATVTTVDDDWIQPDKNSGHLQLVPGIGSPGIAFHGNMATIFPMLRRSPRLIPNVFHVTYTAGFESGKVPENIRNVIGMAASYGPLNIAGDLLGGAGIASQSIGIDGLSQSFATTSSATNAGYGARLVQYTKQIKEEIKTLRDHWQGVRLIAV